MTYFLTSNPCLPGSLSLNPANGFVEELKKALPKPCRALFIGASFFKESVESFRNDMCSSFAEIGIPFEWAEVVNWENQDWGEVLALSADVIFLCGGDVLRQNRLLEATSMKECLADWDGVVVGIGTGSMNAAEWFCVPPEELNLDEEEYDGPLDGNIRESLNWFSGLGLTRHMILPNFQRKTGSWLNGKYNYDDYDIFACLDYMVNRKLRMSTRYVMKREFYEGAFYALVDGSYILGRDGREKLYGEAYLLKEGSIQEISREGDCVELYTE